MKFLKNPLLWGSISVGVILILTIGLIQGPSYVLSQVKDSLFNYQLSWSPLPNFGYEVTYIDNDGDSMAVWDLENKAENQEVIIYLHGNGGKIIPHIQEMQQFGRVISPAYPGYHDSEGRPTPENVRNTGVLTFDYLVEEEGVNPQNITIFGQSLGGSPAMYTASQRSQAKQVVVVNTFSSVQNMCQRQVPIFCGQTENILNSEQYAQNIEIPAHVFIYEDDSVINPEEGKELFQAIASSDKEQHSLEKYSHTYFDVEEVFNTISR